jgi:alpha-mannosidase
MAALALLVLAHFAAGDAEASPSRSRRLYNTTAGPRAGYTNVHLIAHSHDDVGWLKSPSDYFTGSRVIGIDAGGSGLSVYYANGAVQFILTSVVDALSANPDRVFVVVENWFFQRWWISQDEGVQDRVRELVTARQLVFANGGLVMHDEACPTYIDMLDQTSAGVRWIAETFGPGALPRVTSQLDPFGHSAFQAAVLSSPLSGYIAQFHAREDYQEEGPRNARQTMDFAWAPSNSLGLGAMTLGSLGPFGYSAPDGFCVDIGIECQAESAALYSMTGLNNPINDEAQRGLADAVGDNVLAYMAQVQATVAGMLSKYPRDPDGTVHLPWTMGDDFDYGAAAMNFASMDKLVHYVNLNSSLTGLNMFYSSQAAYAEARLGMVTPLSLKTADGFPYADSAHSVWSGYFTSRPALKGYVRDTSVHFTAVRQLQAWAGPLPSDTGRSNPLWLLESGLGIAQHHDAVSGTSKQVVAFDYARRIQAGRDAANAAMAGWLNGLLGLVAGLPWAACELANATLCGPLEADGGSRAVALLLYNPQSLARPAAPVRVPVSGGDAAASWAVLGGDGATHLPAQLLPQSPADAALRAYYGAPPPGGNASWLAFYAPQLPPMGWTLVFLQPVATIADAPFTAASEVRHVELTGTTGADPSLSNAAVTLSFDGATGLLASFNSSSTASLPHVALAQTLASYTPSTGADSVGQASGAYILRPTAAGAAPLAPTVRLTLVSGPLVSEAWQDFTPWASQVVRLWRDDTNGFEVEATVGPLPAPSAGGAELITRLTVGWDTGGAWRTDSNGRDWQLRQRNRRPDFNITVTEEVAQNYYPVNTGAQLQDTSGGGVLTVLTDRTQGGASLADGELELMLHRRLPGDDSRGVLESLNEPGVDGAGLRVRCAHRVLLTPPAASAPAHRAALQDVLLPALLRLATLPPGATPASWVAARPPPAPISASLLAAPLPPALSLVTLHALNATSALLRLAHLFEAEEGALAANVTIGLAGLLAPPSLRITAATEMTAPGGQPLASVPPVTYKLDSGQSVTLPVLPPPPVGPQLAVTLSPMQIRTFVVHFAG